jgi:predicted Zn-dependent peptidase
VLESKKDIAIDLIADMLTASRFAEEQLALERKVVVEEIGDVDDAPEDLIHELFAAEMYPQHPLGRPILGYRKTVAAFQRNDLLRYARRAFRSSNLVVAVYGNIDVAELTKICETRFAFPKGTLVRDGTRFPAPLARRRHVRRKLHQQHVCMGARTFSYLDDRRYALMVLNAALGGGMSSRLFQKIREEMGLAYNVYTYVDHTRDTGMFAAYMAVNPATAGRAIEAVTDELETIRKGGLTRTELRDTKDHIKGRILLGLETSASRMMRLARNEISYGRQVPERELLKRLAAVKSDDVAEVARELLDTDRYVMVSLGPSGAGLN